MDSMRPLIALCLFPLIFPMTLGALGCASQDSAPEAAVSLEGTDWKPLELNGKALQPMPTGDQGAHLWFDASEKRMSGYTGINQINGPYQLQGNTLRFGPLVTTRKAGPEALMKQESALAQALARTAGWRPAGNGAIELVDAGGQVLIKLVPSAG
jgi:heat shock protein HslJ